MSHAADNPVDRLSSQIEADARRKADRAKKKADREAGKILADARKQADALVEQALADATERAERDCRTLLASVPLEVQRDRLACQQEAMEQVRQQAEDEAAAQQGDARYAVLLRLVIQAVRVLDAPGCVALLGDADRRAFADRLTRDVSQTCGWELGIEAASPSIQGGAVVRTADGKRLCDNSTEARFARQWDDLRTEVARVLFPDLVQSPTPGGASDDAST